MGVFDVLGVRHETAHTKLLAWLLDPNGDHGLGSMLLQEICRNTIPSVGDLDGALVKAEAVQEGSRPDITITTARRYVMLENKIRDEAFSPKQLIAHVNGALAMRSDGQRPFLLVLIPDEQRLRAPALPRHLGCEHQRRDWRWVLRCLHAVLGKAPAGSAGRAFIPAYCEFIEREVLRMWKGFDVTTLNDDTAAAAVTFLTRQRAVESQLRQLVEAVVTGLSSKRQGVARRAGGPSGGEESYGYPTLGGFRWTLSSKYEDSLYLTLYARPGATSVKELELWLELFGCSPSLLNYASAKKWTKREEAKARFGAWTIASFENNSKTLYVGTRIPHGQWWATTPQRARGVVENVRVRVERYWNAYDEAMA